MTIRELKERTENKYNKLIDRFLESNEALNGHTGEKDKVDGLLFFNEYENKEYELKPCGFYKNTAYFSTNPVKLTQHGLYISTWCQGSCVVNQPSYQLTIDHYNDTCNWDRFKVRFLLLADGTIYESTNN